MPSRPPLVDVHEVHKPSSPINVILLESELSSHPDQAWCSRLLNSLQLGTTIGYQGPRFARTAPNLPSASKHPEVITEELRKECARDHIAGPYIKPPLHNLQCSGVGVVPKKNGSWRMIMHLSSPPLRSINDGIDKEDYSLSYSHRKTRHIIR